MRIKAYLSLCTSVHCCLRPLGANQVSGLRAVGVGLGGDGTPWIPPLLSYTLTRKLTERLITWKYHWMIKGFQTQKNS